MSDFSVRSDNVDVEQIMRQIRSRIREKRGVDYTEDEIRELANVKLEKFIDPKGVRSDLLQQYRQAREASLPPNYKFEDTTLFETHRGPLAFIRRLLRPVLKLFLNPNPLIDALHIQSKLNDAHAAIEPLHYEIIHNLVLELTRASIEVKSLKMRLESMASRLDFDERRARALEGVVQYRPGAVAPLQPPTGQEPRREGRRDQGSRDQGRRDQGQRDRGPREERPRDSGPRDRGPQPPREVVVQPQAPRPEGQESNALDNDGNERRSRRRRRRGRRRGAGSGAGPMTDGRGPMADVSAGTETEAGGSDSGAESDIDDRGAEPGFPDSDQSEVEHVSDVDRRPSGQERQASAIDDRPSDIDHRSSDIDHRSSDIDHRPSDIDHRPSDIEHRPSAESSDRSPAPEPAAQRGSDPPSE